VTGRRSERVYVVRSGAEKWAFVPHPEVSGWWFRCHPSVVVSPCSHCKSQRGQPCRDLEDGYKSSTHWVRRRDAAKGVQALDYATCIVTTIAKGKGQPCV
jgi:hypothetical protein